MNREGEMKSPAVWSILAVGLLAVCSANVRANPNPHNDPQGCPNCHLQIPTAEDAAAGRLFLVSSTIDDTCRTCHACCRMGARHQSFHPTGVNEWDREKKRLEDPKVVPLFGGFITCSTCHAHPLQEPTHPALLRWIDRKTPEEDHSDLCRDCHIGY